MYEMPLNLKSKRGSASESQTFRPSKLSPAPDITNSSRLRRELRDSVCTSLYSNISFRYNPARVYSPTRKAPFPD